MTRVGIGCLSLLLTLCAGEASAWDPKKDLCLSRSYDAEHLKKNPRQQVVWIAIDLLAEPDADGGWRGGIFLRTRSGKYVYVTDAFCERPKKGQDPVALSCRYSFDGGPTFQLTRRDGGVETRLPKASYVVDDQEMDLSDREAKGVQIEADVYRLSPSPCRPKK